MSERRILARETEIKVGGSGGKMDFTVKEGRFKGEEGGQAKRASIGEVEQSMSG